MANSSDFTLGSYTTAVVLIPSQDIQDKVNALRKGNDKAYSRWMPHITLLFPFVAPEQLQHAVLHLTERIRESSLSPINVTLDHIGQFSQKGYNTVYLAASSTSNPPLQDLWSCVSSSFGYAGRPFVPHMTLGQKHRGQPTPQALGLLATQLAGRCLSWTVDKVAVLQKDAEDGGIMKVHAEIPLCLPSEPVGLSESPPPSTAAAEDQDDSSILRCLKRQGEVPSAQHGAQIEALLTSLRRLLASHTDMTEATPSSSPSGLNFVVEPVGDYLLGVHTENEPVRCIVVGNIPASSFWPSLQEKVKSSSELSGKHVKDGDVKQFLLAYGNIRLRIRYACAPGLVVRWSEVPGLSSENPLLSLAASTLKILNEFRDSKTILHTLGSERLPTFQLTHRILSAICRSRGLLGASFGFLTGSSLAIILTQAIISQPDLPCSVLSYIHAFLRIFIAHNWEGAEFRLLSATGSYKAWDGDAMRVLSVHKPLINYTLDATLSTLDTMKRELGEVARALEKGASVQSLCTSGSQSAEAGFLKAFPHFVKIELTCWSRNQQKSRLVLSEIQAQVSELLSHLRLFTTQELRLWPGVFRESGSELSSVKSNIVLVGLAKPLEGVALEFLQEFERKFHSNSADYDSNSQYFSVSQINSGSLASHTLELSPPVDLFAVTADDSDSGSDSDSLHGGLEREPPPPDPTWDPESFSFSTSVSKRKLKSLKRQSTKQRSPAHIAAPKLRPSVDVYNRLMWDSKAGERTDYMVGYEDRFAGLMEIGIESWKRDMDDKEFIPFHRVVYFRKISDDKIIWDRRTKLDLVFNSGISTPTAPS